MGLRLFFKFKIIQLTSPKLIKKKKKIGTVKRSKISAKLGSHLKFHAHRVMSYRVIKRTDRQTDKQSDRQKNK